MPEGKPGDLNEEGQPVAAPAPVVTPPPSAEEPAAAAAEEQAEEPEQAAEVAAEDEAAAEAAPEAAAEPCAEAGPPAAVEVEEAAAEAEAEAEGPTAEVAGPPPVEEPPAAETAEPAVAPPDADTGVTCTPEAPEYVCPSCDKPVAKGAEKCECGQEFDWGPTVIEFDKPPDLPVPEGMALADVEVEYATDGCLLSVTPRFESEEPEDEGDDPDTTPE
jgi:hypothetical protein